MSDLAPMPTLQECMKLRQFLVDLTDPEKYAFAVRDPEITRRALELLKLDLFK